MTPKLYNAPVPSSAALRFLRKKVDEPSFFNTNFPTISRPYRKPESSVRVRHLTTSKRHQAIVLPGFLDLCFEPPSRLPLCQSKVFGGFSQSARLRSHYDGNGDNPADACHTSKHRHPWFKRMLKRNGSHNGEEDHKVEDLHPLPTFLDDAAGTALGRSKAGKPGSEVKLRCTEVDKNGNVITVNGEFKKSELIAKYGLLPRDLRKIDSSLLPHILVRPSAILINLLHLRVLIKHDCVLVLDAYGSSDTFAQSQFMYDLSGKLSQKDSRQSGGLPYEFRALEAVLISVTTGLEAEFGGVSEPVVRVLRDLEEDIDRDKLRHLLVLSKKLGTFEQKARLVREAIDDLLEADDDLVTMYLTEASQGKKREEHDHTEVEMLLESYHKVTDEIVQVSGNLVNNIRNTEDIVRAILDANRNALMLLDLKFSIGTLGIGSGAFIASLYGMNLKNFLEESDLGFLGVSGWSSVLALAVCYIGLKKLRRVQRVSMWGERGRGGDKGSWRDVSGATRPRVEAQARKERLERMKKGYSLGAAEDDGGREALLPVVSGNGKH